MSSYFPLLPSISLNRSNKEVTSSTTLLNIANNLKESNRSKEHFKSIYFGTYKHEVSIWKLVSIQECKYGEFCDVKRNSINASQDKMVVSLFRFENSFPKSCRILPKPDSLRVDSSPVAERGSLNYHLESATTTYQGEYPYEMANLDKGTFWSFDAVKENIFKNDHVNSFLVLMNINRNSEKQNKVNLEIYNPHQKDKILNWEARQNSFTVINLKEINKALQSEHIQKTFFIQSEACTFIPMILSVDSKNNQLSFEHTHPPSELFWGRDKFKVTDLIKKRWI